MPRIHHDHYEMHQIYRVILPRWKQYRFRFISPRLFCMFAIVYIPLLPYSTFFWLCISIPLLYFIYHNNSFFIDRCDQLLFGIQPQQQQQSTINNKAQSNNNYYSNKSSLVSSGTDKADAHSTMKTKHSTKMSSAKVKKLRKSMMKLRNKKKTMMMIDDHSSNESEDDFDYEYEYDDHHDDHNNNDNNIINKIINNDIINNESNDNSNYSSGASSTLPSPLHSNDVKLRSKKRSFSRTSLKYLFKRLTPTQQPTTATINTTDCDTQPSDYDPDQSNNSNNNSNKKSSKQSKKMNNKNIHTTNSVVMMSPLSVKRKKSLSMINQENRRAISMTNLTTINGNLSSNEPLMSEPIISTEDSDGLSCNSIGGNYTNNEDKYSSNETIKKVKKSRKRNIYRLFLYDRQKRKKLSIIPSVQDDDSCPSKMTSDNESVDNYIDGDNNTSVFKNQNSLPNNETIVNELINDSKAFDCHNSNITDDNNNELHDIHENDCADDDNDSLKTLMTQSTTLKNNNDDEALIDENNNENDDKQQQQKQQSNRLSSQYPFYQIDVHLKYGENLLAKDSCGTSDPYCKFIWNNRVLYKSQIKYKTLNPKWDEYFVLSLDNIDEPLKIKVFDYDLFSIDDFLGMATIDLGKLEPGITTDLEVCLRENLSYTENNKSNSMYRGRIVLSIRLNPKSLEEREYYYGRGKWTTVTASNGQTNKRIRSQLYDSIVSIVLIKGNELKLDHDYCVRMRLGMEKYKSKSVAKAVTCPYWGEQFDFHLYADQSKVLEIIITYIGQQQQQQHQQQQPNQPQQVANNYVYKVCTDLSELQPEYTHHFVYSLSNDSINKMNNHQNSTILSNNNSQANIEVLITITGLQSNSIARQSNEKDIMNLLAQRQQLAPFKRLFSIENFKDLNHLYDNLFDIGTLIVKVHRAENLASADLNGKSDPFCVLELVNQRLRTSTEYKTLSPEWNKLFKFKINDIHDVLEISVYDEDKDRAEFLGKIMIPLLKIRNGEKQWYALKDKKLRHRAKGQIYLECWIEYNMLKASILTFRPRPTKYVQNEIKFKRTIFIRNAMRLKNICLEFLEIAQFLHSCIQWESPTRSILAFITFLTSVYYFEFYMIPLVLVMYILMNYATIRFRQYLKRNNQRFGQQSAKQQSKQTFLNTFINEYVNDDYGDDYGDYLDYNNIDYIDETKMIDDDFDDKPVDKKTFKEKLHTVQDLSTLVMLIIGQIASYIERCKNATNFTVPYLTWLAVICMTGTTIIFYFIPIRYLILLWGINQFTKKFRSPNSVDNNEIIDFLSRVPDMEEKNMYKQFKPNLNH